MQAIVIGATGLTGKELVQQLIQHDAFDSITIFVRRKTEIVERKLKEIIIDFNQPSEWSDLVRGTVLFSTLGTTLIQAGSRKAQYKIDYTFQYRFAEAAASNGVEKYVLVSSADASSDSRIFYSRMKGELERDVRLLSFKQVDILQPSIIDGDRKDKRPLEQIGLPTVKLLNRAGLFNQYRPVHASVLATAMIKSALKNSPGVHVWKKREVFDLAGK